MPYILVREKSVDEPRRRTVWTVATFMGETTNGWSLESEIKGDSVVPVAFVSPVDAGVHARRLSLAGGSTVHVEEVSA